MSYKIELDHGATTPRFTFKRSPVSISFANNGGAICGRLYEDENGRFQFEGDMETSAQSLLRFICTNFAVQVIPVVEQKDLPCIHPDGCTFCAWCGFKADQPLPELAELQATIARLAAENERLSRVEYQSREALQVANQNTKQVIAESDAHKAEIERLKGGAGGA